MNMQNPASGNDTDLPKTRPAKTIMTRAEWAEMHDSLTLAVDALGEGPADVDGPYLRNCIMHVCATLRLANKLKERHIRQERMPK